MSSVISINVHLNGYWASARDLEGRDRLLKELNERNTGNLLGSGSNYRGMYFAYEVDHEIVGKSKIQLMLDKHLPGRTYTIETMQMAIQQETKVARGIIRPQGHFQQRAAGHVKQPQQLKLGLDR